MAPSRHNGSIPEPVWGSFGQQTFQPLAPAGSNAHAFARREAFLNVLCYVRSWLVDLESCETLHHGTLKNVSDGQLAVASSSVPLDRHIPHKFYTGYSISRYSHVTENDYPNLRMSIAEACP